MKRRLVPIITIALLAAACSGGGDGRLTVYSGRSEELVAPLIERFEEETGIDVAVRYAGSPEIAATLLEEGENSPADVVFTQDPASIGSVALAGMLAELPEDVLATVPASLSDRDGRWVGVSGRARTLVYDTERYEPSAFPATEDGLTDEAWAGKVGIAPSNGSFLAFVSAKILLDGEDATRTWLEGMAANQAPTYPKNSPIVAAVADGQLDTGLVNHYYLLRRLVEQPDAPAENYFFPTASAGSLVMPAGVGVLRTAANPDAGDEFIRFLLTEEAQEFFASETFEYPLLPGVPANPKLPAIESIATPDIDLSELATVLDLATDLVSEAGLL